MVFDKFGNFQESRFFSQDGENKFFLDYISNFFTKKHKRKKEGISNSRCYSGKKKWVPKTIYDKKNLLKKLSLRTKEARSLAIVGHINHGKSSLINCLASSVHLSNEGALFTRFSDFSFLEQQRGITMQISVTTLLMCDKKGDSHILWLIDNPGHPDFFDQAITSMAFSEGGILVLDISDGVLLGTELSLRYLIYLDLPVIVVLNALDRLILEFGLSPRKIQKKILQVLDELNSVIEHCYPNLKTQKLGGFRFFNPIDNNVCFASLKQGWTFTLDQFSEMYLSSQPSVCFSVKDLTFILWGNRFSSPDHFKILNEEGGKHSMFEEFIIVPLFKIMLFNIGESSLHLRKFIETELGIFGINQTELAFSLEKCLKVCMTLFFGGCRDNKLFPNHTGLISSIVDHSPVFGKSRIFERERLNKKTFSVGYIWKLLPSLEKQNFLSMTKILKGRIQPGISICILTEGHSLYWDQNYRSICPLKKIFLSIGSYNLNVNYSSMGSMILIEGVDKFVKKSAIFSDLKSDVLDIQKISYSIIKNLYLTEKTGIISILIQGSFPHQNKELYENIRKCCRVHTKLNCKIENSGEIILNGTGGLFLNIVLLQLAKMSKEVNFKTSAPFLNLKETVFSNPKEFFFSKNLKLHLTKYENRDSKIDLNLQFGICFFRMKKILTNNFQLRRTLTAGYICKNIQNTTKANKLEANSFWSFGFQFPNSPHCRLKSTSHKVGISKKWKKIFLEGFEWAINEGPICGKPMNEIIFAFKYIKHEERSRRNDYEFLGHIKRFLQTVFLENQPKFQEPWFIGEIITFTQHISTISMFVEKRRGFVISMNFKEKELSIRFSVSVLASFDFEKSLQNLTQDKTFCVFFFDIWKNLPSHSSTKHSGLKKIKN